jgi:GNAT superfamily N-acetyltransferase
MAGASAPFTTQLHLCSTSSLKAQLSLPLLLFSSTTKHDKMPNTKLQDGGSIRHATLHGIYPSVFLLTLRILRNNIDVPEILAMIQELALYEKEPDAVEATVESLSKTLAFAPHPEIFAGASTPSTGDSVSSTRPARCFLLFPPSTTESLYEKNETKAAGMALYFYNYSTWRSKPGIYLEDLFVRPEYRSKGYGVALLQELAKEVVEMPDGGGGRLEWSVLKWNEPSIKFYVSEKIGAKRMEEWVGMRVEGEGLKKLAGGR